MVSTCVRRVHRTGCKNGTTLPRLTTAPEKNLETGREWDRLIPETACAQAAVERPVAPEDGDRAPGDDRRPSGDPRAGFLQEGRGHRHGIRNPARERLSRELPD